jgi:hypothetical protein
MRLTKAERTALKDMFGGRCAYCGQPLGDRWHADHVKAVKRTLVFVRGKGVVHTGKLRRPANDCVENLMPACAPCNIDKHARTLEQWRVKLQGAPGVLARNQPTYRHAVRFGLVQETQATVVFYFERLAAESS